MSNIRIDIASEFKDKGFKQAAKSSTMLEKQFKSLARTFLAVFSTRQIIAFGKASVKAFSDDETAAKRLSQTLNNLNLGFEDPRISAFISTIERQTGVLDDQLRPAMESLLRTTGSVATSQNLLSLAIDIAAGSGQSLTTVAGDLSKAYVGNNRALSKYNIGLAKTELQSATFLEIQERLTKQYSGQNAAFLTSYAGKVNVLRVAYANMQETVGEGLVDAFSTLSGKDGIGGAAKAIEDFGDNAAFAIGGVVAYIQMLDRSISGISLNPLIKWFIQNQGPIQLLSTLINTGKTAATAPKPFKLPMTISGQSDLYSKQDKARKQAEEAAAKRAKELAALQKKADEEKKKRERMLAAQKRAQTIFDIENIQIVAALQGKIDGEQRMRLVALLALNTENYTAAEKLTDIVVRLNAPALANLGVLIQAGDTVDDVIKKLITSQAKLAGLQLMAEDFPELDNIFEDWETSLENILKMLMEMFAMLNGQSAKATIYPYSTALGRAVNPYGAVNRGEYSDIYGSLAQTPSDYSTLGLGASARGEYSSYIPRMSSGGTNVTVNVAGNVTTEGDLVNSITNALYQSQKDGKNILYSSTAI